MTCSFSVKHYLETINAYRDAGYTITPVSDVSKNKIPEKHILLRHDIDLSLDYALDMALLEKDNNIHSTYFILLRSDLYNTLSPTGSDRVRAIKEAGHEIGLHIDTRHYMGSVEFDILSTIANECVYLWTQHLITVTPPLDIPNQISYKNIPYKYLSDSAMNFREGCFCTHVNQYDKLQILCHPEWWTVSPSGLRTKWEILQDLKEEAKGQIASSFRDFGNIVSEYMQVLKA